MRVAPLASAAMADLLNFVRGFLMGSADVVPGVSGGTVALVLGIYERLIRAIRNGANALWSIVRGRRAGLSEQLRTIDWRFLSALLAGILVAVVTLAALIEHLLEDEPQNTSALFFGLVAGSIVIAWRLVDNWTASYIGAALVTAVAAFALLGLRSDEITDPGVVLFFGAGAIAIVAMILPGLSGSFILVTLGMYKAVLGSVNNRDLGMLLVFIFGAIIGLAIFSTLLDRLLLDYRAITMAILIGLMTGSLRVLWPWPDGTETATLSSPQSPTVPLLLAVAGFAAVVALSRLVGRPALEKLRPASGD